LDTVEQRQEENKRKQRFVLFLEKEDDGYIKNQPWAFPGIEALTERSFARNKWDESFDRKKKDDTRQYVYKIKGRDGERERYRLILTFPFTVRSGRPRSISKCRHSTFGSLAETTLQVMSVLMKPLNK